MTRQGMAITIDGPAASGKSSTAQMVAERIGFLHIDSGSLYRAATAAALRAMPDTADWREDLVLRAAGGVSLAAARTSFYPVIGGRSVEGEIRGESVTGNVSAVAKMPAMREWVNDAVRAAATGRNIVADGRDMGTVVFPNAGLKIFLVADAAERARRRLRQRGEELEAQAVADETQRIAGRDARDAAQTLPAKDAVVMDTTALTQAEQLEKIVTLARERYQLT